MSARIIALGFLVLAALAGGAWLVLETEPGGTTVETDEDPLRSSRESSEGRSSDPLDKTRGETRGGPGADELREQVQNPAEGRGERKSAPAGESVVRVRFVQNKKPLADREVKLQSLSASGSSLYRSDAEGRLEVGGLSSGRYRFAVQGEDMPRGDALPVFQLEDREVKDLGDMNVPMVASLRGRLRTGTGAAVAEARISLDKPGFSDFLTGKSDAPSVGSDAQGRFHMTRLAPGKYVLRVDHPSYLRLDRHLEIKEGEQVDLGRIELDQGLSIRGQVVDQQNKPIADAQLQAEIQTRIGTSVVRGYSEARAVQSDERGRFVIGGLGAATRLLVKKKGYQEIRDVDVDMERRFIRIQLQVERGISGRVRGIPKGRGRDVRIYVSEQVSVGASGLDVYMDRDSVNCDEAGRFHISGLERGDYRLVASLEGHGFSSKHSLSLGDRPVSGVELVLERGGQLAVRVLDKNQRPIQGARIVLEAMDPLKEGPGQRVRIRGQAAIRLRGRSDEQGVARLEGIFQGMARLSVQHDRYLGLVEEMEITAGDQQKLVHLSLGGWIQGQALDSSGIPITGAEILIAKASGNAPAVELGHGHQGDSRQIRQHALESGKAGAFKSESLAPGLYEVWFKSVREIRAGGASITFRDGKEKKPGRVEVRVAEGQISQVKLRKPVSGTLRGRVTYKGLPAVKAQVFAWPAGKDSFDAKQVVCDKDGRYRLADLEPGAWQCCAKPEKGGVATPIRTFEVAPGGGEVRRDLQLGGGLVRGRCSMPSGHPLPSGLVAILEEGVLPGQSPKKRSTRQISIMLSADKKGNRKLSQMVMRPPTDPEPVRIKRDGSFEIEYVAEGPWQLVIEGKGSVRLASKSFSLAADQVLDLGLVELDPVFPVLLSVQDEQGQPLGMGSLTVYRKRKGQSSERVWSGLVQKGKIRIPGLASGRYRLRMTKITSGQGAKSGAQETDLEVRPDGSAIGSDYRFK